MNKIIKYLQPSKNLVWFGVSAEIKKNWFNYGIEWFTQADYSHALAFWWSEDIENFIVTNAHGVGVQLDSIDQFFEGSLFKRLWQVKVNDTQRLSFLKEAIRRDGTPYSDRNIHGIILAKILHARLNPLADRNKALFCSEYTDNLMEAIDLDPAHLILDIDHELVSPKDNVYAFEILAGRDDRVFELDVCR